MASLRRLIAIIQREESGYSALCPEYEIGSQGRTIEEARDNLVEGLSLFFECADPTEVEKRFQPKVLVTDVEVRVG